MSPLWTLQRLCFGPDVAATDVDRGENRDLGKAITEANKKQLTEEARLENGPLDARVEGDDLGSIALRVSGLSTRL